MPEELSELEHRVLDYLVAFLRNNTYQPSIREIGTEFGIRSTKTVSEILDSLATKGWIERDRARSRGIRVIGLDLSSGTTTVPCVDADATGGAHTLELDRRLAGVSGAFLLPMPDDSLCAEGIHRGDLLLVEPLAAQRPDEGDLVVVSTAGGRNVRRFHAAAPGAWPKRRDAASRPDGRVLSVMRRLRAPRSTPPESSPGEAPPGP